MGFTAFVAEMSDGKKFSYDTESMAEAFYDLPDGYQASDIKKVYSGMLYTEKYGMESYIRNSPYKMATFFGKRRCLYCYLKGLDSNAISLV
jgi:hypothetical protein